eukprot:PhF_6_TR10051/c2_g3_i1/m.15490
MGCHHSYPSQGVPLKNVGLKTFVITFGPQNKVSWPVRYGFENYGDIKTEIENFNASDEKIPTSDLFTSRMDTLDVISVAKTIVALEEQPDAIHMPVCLVADELMKCVTLIPEETDGIVLIWWSVSMTFVVLWMTQYV